MRVHNFFSLCVLLLLFRVFCNVSIALGLTFLCALPKNANLYKFSRGRWEGKWEFNYLLGLKTSNMHDCHPRVLIILQWIWPRCKQNAAHKKNSHQRHTLVMTHALTIKFIKFIQNSEGETSRIFSFFAFVLSSSG